jgi:undecaprenyl-diphosphatase
MHLVALAIVQGVAEFLPISSSAHLILLPMFAGWSDQGLSVDVALHMGTLAAVLTYFRSDVVDLARGAVDTVAGRAGDTRRLFVLVALGTLPAVVIGIAAKPLVEGALRSAEVIAATTMGFGLVLFAADRIGSRSRELQAMTALHALLIGLAQAIALVPGVSRSGITMSAALIIGFTRPEAARFSFLLSIPTTFAAGVLVAAVMVRDGAWALGWEVLVAAGVSFATAFLAIAGLMAWLRRWDFTPFVLYRLALGVVLLIWIAR